MNGKAHSASRGVAHFHVASAHTKQQQPVLEGVNSMSSRRRLMTKEFYGASFEDFQLILRFAAARKPASPNNLCLCSLRKGCAHGGHSVFQDLGME